MKYLLFTLFFLLSCSIISAQDTLYLKGQKEPLLVNIVIVKKNSLNYKKLEASLIRTVKMKDVREIRYKNTDQKTLKQQLDFYLEKIKYPDFDEFRSTIFINYSSLIQRHFGINYLYHLKGRHTPKDKRNNIFAIISSGYFDRKSNFSVVAFFPEDEAVGAYLKVGVGVEIENRRNPMNRFHIGLNIYNRFIEQINVNSEIIVYDYAFQIPIAYTLRSSEGAYFTAGLEFSNEVFFALVPAINIGLGVAFGK